MDSAASSAWVWKTHFQRIALIEKFRDNAAVEYKNGINFTVA